MDINKLLANDKGCSQYGAQMGRRNYCDNPAARVHLQRVQFIDGDYDRGGAYWGGGRGTDPLFCAMDQDGEVRVFVRAKSREDAKTAILADYPELTFYR